MCEMDIIKNKIILWDLKCPLHNIPLLAESDESVFAWCPSCECSYFKFELKDPQMHEALLKKYKNKITN